MLNLNRKKTAFSLTSQTNPNDCPNRDTEELMTNVALDGVGAFDVPPHVSLQVLLQSPRYSRARRAGADEHTQSRSYWH